MQVTFDLETWNFEGQGQQHGLQSIELIKIYLHVKYERVDINNISTRMAAFQGIHVFLRNIHVAMLEYQESLTTGQTDRGQNDLYVPLYFRGDTTLDLNTKLHLTLKRGNFKVKDKGCIG